MAIKCVRVRSGIFRDNVLFRATNEHSAIFSTMLGDKEFWMEAGDEVVLKMPKSEMWERGDKARNLSVLITTTNQHKFKWQWA